MKKNYFIPNVIVFVIISIILFLLPLEYKNVSSFVFTYIVYIIFTGFGIYLVQKWPKGNLKKDVNNITILSMHALFQIILIILLFCSRCIFISEYLTLIILTVILGIYILLFYLFSQVKQLINKTEDKIIERTKNAQKWQAKLEILVLNNQNKNITKNLQKIYETVKYMDSTSHEEVQKVDEQINEIFSKIKDDITTVEIEQLTKLFNERKIILKNSK